MIFYSSLFNQKTSKKQIKKPTLQDIHSGKCTFIAHLQFIWKWELYTPLTNVLHSSELDK